MTATGARQAQYVSISARTAAGGKLTLFNAYGPMEAGLTATIYEAGSSHWENASLVPIGKPIRNTRVYVLDDCGNPVPMGVSGELYIAGDSVVRGYLNAPDLSAAKFLPDTYGADPAKRMFRTGDQVFSLPDGNLGVPEPRRPAGEDPRFPGRAGRNRSGARGARRGAPLRGGGAR